MITTLNIFVRLRLEMKVEKLIMRHRVCIQQRTVAATVAAVTSGSTSTKRLESSVPRGVLTAKSCVHESGRIGG